MNAHFFLMASLFSLAVVAADNPAPLAPGYLPLGYTAPIPGSYQLPALGKAADGEVLDSDGKNQQLHNLLDGKLVVLSFIYSTCSDVNGCPLASAVLHKIHSRLKKEPGLAKQIRLITLSFNPENDTPERMRQYGGSFAAPGIDWQFLTTRSERQLQPILDGYRQHVQKVYDGQGKFTGTFAHDLRVFLIDNQQQIRNIYSVSFLHADTLINDLKTLLQTGQANKTPAIALALQERTGAAANLLKATTQPILGLPALPVPDDNPLTTAKIGLGRKLFYDRRLSLNNTFSCAMCHIPEQGFTSNEMATAVGIEGRTVRRNSPTLYNVGHAKLLFHDGRENTLEQQVWGPLLAHNEMANPSIGYVVDKIKNLTDYSGLFEQAFGKHASMETIGMALASYQRTLNSANSPFDRWYYGHDKQALSAQAQRGFKLFTGKAGCSACHSITGQYALFTDQQLHNTGIGYAKAMQKPASSQRVQLAPGVYTEVSTQFIQSVSERKPNDLGRYEITQNPADRWRYKTPTLRNISLTAPYMHNGSLRSLKEVVEFYNRGGVTNENLDSLIKPLGLSELEIADLAAFLATLTGDNTKALVEDAFAAPIGDSQF
ncbi:MAG: cytochrome c peroxidase [Methylovulum sp.]|nr:cytochrome c peroxidase [Methylovulum sp.]